MNSKYEEDEDRPFTSGGVLEAAVAWVSDNTCGQQPAVCRHQRQSCLRKFLATGISKSHQDADARGSWSRGGKLLRR